jgi:hypothetical protein
MNLKSFALLLATYVVAETAAYDGPKKGETQFMDSIKSKILDLFNNSNEGYYGNRPYPPVLTSPASLLPTVTYNYGNGNTETPEADPFPPGVPPAYGKIPDTNSTSSHSSVPLQSPTPSSYTHGYGDRNNSSGNSSSGSWPGSGYGHSSEGQPSVNLGYGHGLNATDNSTVSNSTGNSSADPSLATSDASQNAIGTAEYAFVIALIFASLQ